jgi:hypothetical protein
MTRTLPLAKLVEDMALYPRHVVDDIHVARLVEALRAGAQLPPVIAEAKSNRIVDGWHRVRAYRKFLGPEASIDVEVRTYKNEADLLADAIRLNSAHGRPFDRVDQVRIVHLAEETGLPTEVVSRLLQVTTDRVLKLRVRVAHAKDGPRKIPLKRSVAHLAGETFTPAQETAHASAPGTSYLLVARQLTDGLRFGFVRREDERMADALRELAEAIDLFLRAGRAA